MEFIQRRIKMEFTYSSYSILVEKIRAKGYIFSGYSDCDQYKKNVIFRHDVDFSMKKAVDLANLESELGVKSTYFVLLSTDFYNIHSKYMMSCLEQIINLGHDLGLHFDETKYNFRCIEELSGKILQEIGILNKELGKDMIYAVSMHRPSECFLNSNLSIHGVINSYSDKFFKDYKYVSDSRMNWKENIFDIIDSEKYSKLHILTHPFWYSEKKETIEYKMERFLLSATKDRYQMMDDNFTNLSEVLERVW